MTWRRKTLATLALALLIGVLGLGEYSNALVVPPAPSLDRPIVDQTGTLSEQQMSDLSAQINTSQKTKDYQIGILLIPTLGGDEYLEGYSLKVAREWGIGQKDKDNGVLLLIVKNDRKMRIEVGRGLEGDLTDVESSRIMRQVLAPNFKQNNYYHGITAAVESIQAQVEGRADPNTSEDQASSGVTENIFMLVLFGIFWLIPWMMWIVSILARSKSWWAGGALGALAGGAIALVTGGAVIALIGWAVLTLVGLILDYFVSKNYKQHLAKGDDASWWAGGTWGGSSGGSWGGGSSGGFGGGGFGGGGASGDW